MWGYTGATYLYFKFQIKKRTLVGAYTQYIDFAAYMQYLRRLDLNQFYIEQLICNQ